MTAQNDWVSLSQAHRRLAEILESKATAEILLLEALRSGKIAMAADYYMNGNAYPERILHTGNLRDARFVIWGESRIEHQVERSNLGSKGQTHYHMGDFHRVRLRTADVFNQWPDFECEAELTVSPAAMPAAEAPRKGIGGAKGDYDWERYLIEAAAHIYVNGLPESQEKLFDYLWNLFGGQKGGPSLGSMKNHIGPLYRRFEKIDRG
ncbi:hypothetical protein [Methylobacterium sp. GC_Met_2]|uniref:hypothetical protein n=1 Tax=Methylobacterium sp. GC_Met_2 TaxID=2937376 RepID=UPI00226B55FC|nr:hypothetical protein [Methylobacterium sp. GC_Met_2]